MGEQNIYNKYNSTPRKVFDKHVDRMEIRRQRDKADHRADYHLMMDRIRSLQKDFDELQQHVAEHCRTLRDPGASDVEHGNEELG